MTFSPRAVKYPEDAEWRIRWFLMAVVFGGLESLPRIHLKWISIAVEMSHFWLIWVQLSQSHIGITMLIFDVGGGPRSAQFTVAPMLAYRNFFSALGLTQSQISSYTSCFPSRFCGSAWPFPPALCASAQTDSYNSLRYSHRSPAWRELGKVLFRSQRSTKQLSLLFLSPPLFSFSLLFFALSSLSKSTFPEWM